MGGETPGETGIERLLERLEAARPVRLVGRIREVTGLVIRASVSEARIGDLVAVDRPGQAPLLAEVVGLSDERVTLLPLGSTVGVGPGAEVSSTGEPLRIAAGEWMLGRVLDGLGRPIDGLGDAPEAAARRSLTRRAPHPLRRRRIERPLVVGLRAIDGLLTVGEGQRLGLFAGAGVGKSTLLGLLARRADVDAVVVCLVGERGREVRAFLEDALGEAGRRRTTVIVATADEAPMVRLRSAYTATAVAEHFRDEGQRVLLLMDSLTRFARALRDVGLAAGELPVRHGFPPSVFAALPELVERAGNAEKGSITAVYSVLLAGDDMGGAVADEVRGLLDGHIVLGRSLAERGHWPAIDVLASLSRPMPRLVSAEHADAARRFRRVLATYERERDLISLGAYRYGSNPEVDLAIDCIDEVWDYLRQPTDSRSTFEEAVDRLLDLAGELS